MTTAELIDVQVLNIEVREALKRAATQRAVELCGAKGAGVFLAAVERWQDEMNEIERKGKCLVCGWGFIPGTSVCCDCGRDNS